MSDESIKRHYITQGDREPLLKLVVTQESTNALYDFTGHTSLTFSMVKLNKSDPRAITGVVSVVSLGTLHFSWGVNDTNDPGTFLAQFHGLTPSGRAVSWPNGSYIEVYVLKRV